MGIRRGKLIAIAAVIAGFGLGAGAPAASAETTVSLTFKDTLISQYGARQVLADNEMHGTFYVNSGLIANRAIEITERMSWKQVHELASDGNEIGGGSRSRLHLDLASAAELTAEICDDRTELIRRGYAPVSFGYTFNPSDATAAAKAKVQECGYASARGAGGIGGVGNPVAESIPPLDSYNFRARSINENHALATIKSWVTAAESTGGWLPLVIHSVCNDPGCSITPANFEELVEWLKDRETLPGGGTHVRTVREVMTGTAQPEPPDPLNTTISLAFDDGLDEFNTTAGPEMVESGVRGTFFINSGRVGTDPRFMTWPQVEALDDAGHEIGGHTINDANLAGASVATLNSEVCTDRRTIYDQLRDGATVPEDAPVSFAYPFGAFDAAAKTRVADAESTCTGANNGALFAGDPGYLSGRAVQGLKWYTRTNRCQLLSCKFDEPIHPADPYELKVIGSVGTDDDLNELKQTVENIFNSGGGWATLVFHEICPGPGVPVTPSGSGCPEEDSSTSPEVFEGLTDWLTHTDQTSRGINVRTIEQVMEGAAEPRPDIDDEDPVTTVTCDGGPCGSPFASNAGVSVALSGNDTGGSGFKEIRYAVNGVPTGSSPIYTGPIPINSSATVRFRASDNQGNVEKLKSQDIVVDQAAPTSSIQCNAAACQSHYPTGTVNVTLSAADNPGGVGVSAIRFTTDGNDPTGSSPVYTSAIPVSSATTIKFRAEDGVGNVESPIKSQTIRFDGVQPESSVLCDGDPCESDFYGEVVQATLSATDLPAGPDSSGVKNIRYTTDGNNPTGSSPLYTGAIPLSTTTTLKFRAEDNAGNVESPVESQLIKVDITPPVSSIACDGAPCSLGGYDHVVRVTLETSSPPGEAQPTEIRYTTDGSEPSGSSTLYTGEFFIGETSTVKFRASDEAGNDEATKSQLVRIDTTPPTTTANCNGPSTNCQAAYNAPVNVHLTANDGPDGGGVAEIRYTTNGDEPTGSSTLYSGPFAVNSSATVKFRATDNAGNVESTKSLPILIETTPPTSAISCDGGACIGGFYNAPVLAALSANDSGGAGVKNIRYTTDGSPVTGSSPVYTGSFQVNGPTQVRWRAEDNAGNVEAPQSFTIQIDTQAPTTTIACDGNPCVAAYSAPVSATLDAVDAGTSGIDEIRYTTDGSEPTGLSTLYTGPIPVNSTTQIRWRAQDNAGNVESPLKSRTIIIDTVNPTLTTTCNGVACIAPANYYNGSVSVALNGADTGGSGLKDVRFTSNGSPVTGASPEYTGSPIVFSAQGTHTVNWRVEDNAGRVVTGSQVVNLDLTNPTSSIECDNDPCQAAYPDPVSVTLLPADTGGSGVQNIRFTTNGSAPNAGSPIYTGPIAVNSTTTIRWRAQDNAGNIETPSHTQQVVIDTDGPVTSLACDGAVCLEGGYDHVVRATLSTVTDAPPAEIHYTLDGSEPDENSTLFTEDFFISETTEVKFFAIDDLGTEEPVRTETVLIDTDEPSSAIECNGLACQPFYNGPVNATLEGDDGSGGGIKEIRYTTDGSAPTGSSTLYTGPIPVNATTTIRWRAEDNAGNVETPSQTQLVSIEGAAPTSAIACDGGPCGGFFDEDVTVALSANDTGGSGLKNIRFTTDGSPVTGSSPIYSVPFEVSETTTVRFRAEDNAGNVEAPQTQDVQIDKDDPSSSIECNGNPCVGGFYSGTVAVTLDAADSGAAGIKEIRYTTDGSAPSASSQLYTGSFNVAETSTVRFRAEDNAGNVESPDNSQQIQVENGPPVSSIACDGDDPCKNAYNHAVSATLSAEDDASGVKEIRYTTNGDEPDGTSTIYSGAIPVSATTTIKFRSEDNAGNVEPVNTHTITIEGDAPTSAIECNGAACQPGYYDEQVAVTLTGDDNGGSGIKEIRYTTNGSAPTASSTLYNGPIQLSSSANIRWRAEDNAGNVESPIQQQQVQVDVAAPVSQALCNGAACKATYAKGPVSVALAANDNGGSGVGQIRYTIDGSAVTAATQTYTGPIPITKTTTIRYLSEDNLGNTEATKVQTVKIDAGGVAGKCKKGKKKKGKKKPKKCKKKKKKKKK